MPQPLIPPIPERTQAAEEVSEMPARPPESRSAAAEGATERQVEDAVYAMLPEAAHEIHDRVMDHLRGELRRLILLDRPPAAFVDSLDAFTAQIVNLRSSLAETARVSEEALAAISRRGPSAGSEGRIEGTAELPRVGLVSSAVFNLVGLLSADGAYLGRAVAVDPIALSFELANQWRNDRQVEFYDPSFCPPEQWAAEAWEKDFNAPSKLTAAERGKAFRAIHMLARAIHGLPDRDPGLHSAQFVLDYAREHFERADQILSTLQRKLHAAEPSGVTPLQLIRTGAAIRHASADPNTFFLFARVLSAGGSCRTVKSWMRSLFFGDGVICSAGMVVGFGLATSCGNFIASGVIRRHTASSS